MIEIVYNTYGTKVDDGFEIRSEIDMPLLYLVKKKEVLSITFIEHS